MMDDEDFLEDASVGSPWQQLCQGLTYHQMADGTHVFKMSSIAQHVIDTWVETCETLDAQAYAERQAIFSIYDFRGLIPTPYAIKRIVAGTKKTPKDLREAMAVVVEPSWVAQIIRGVIRRMNANTQSKLILVYSMSDALKWIHRRRQDMGL